MITIGQERHLGRKAYFMMMSKKLGIALGVLFAAMVVVSIQGPLVQSAATSLGNASAASANSVLNSLVIVLLVSSVLIFFVGVFLAKVDYDNLTFTFETYDLVIRRGIITRTESSIPYHHMQSVHIERSPLQQIFGVSRIVLSTAEGNDSVESGKSGVVLEPVDRELADDIRQTIEARMSVDVIEDRDKFTADKGAPLAAAPAASAVQAPVEQPPIQS